MGTYKIEDIERDIAGEYRALMRFCEIDVKPPCLKCSDAKIAGCAVQPTDCLKFDNYVGTKRSYFRVNQRRQYGA